MKKKGRRSGKIVHDRANKSKQDIWNSQASNKIEIVKEDRQLKITKNESVNKKKLQSEDDFFFPYKSKQHRHWLDILVFHFHPDHISDEYYVN